MYILTIHAPFLLLWEQKDSEMAPGTTHRVPPSPKGIIREMKESLTYSWLEWLRFHV